MEINITKQVIDILCSKSPEFKLFFDHHFSITTKQSLTPKIRKGKASFPIEISIVNKQKTFEEKLRYYQEDITLANEKYKYRPDEYILIVPEFSKKEVEK